MSYTVRAVRWEHGWELHIDGVGVTQSRRLTQAERMVRDYLRLDGYRDFATADIVITPEVAGMVRRVGRLRTEAAALAQAQERIATESRAIARELRARGLTGTDTAAVLGVSPQRVSQLLKRA